MNEEVINILKGLQSDINMLVEGTNPNIQTVPNITVHHFLKKIQIDLKKLDTKLFMCSSFLEGLYKNE